MNRKPATATEALYVYLIARTADATKTMSSKQLPTSLEAKAPLKIVQHGAISAVISMVPLEQYGEGRFEEQLKDPQWAAEKVMRHQTIAEFFSGRHPVIPLRFGVMYSSVDKVSSMLKDRSRVAGSALDRIEGREEWALNVYVDKKSLDEKLSTLSPKLAELKARARHSSQGQSYLLEKQAERLRGAEMKSYLKQTADEIAVALEPKADGMKRLPLTELDNKREPAVAGKVIYLVKKSKLRSFRTAAEKLAAKHSSSGFTLELTGPWPPYNFIE